MLLMHFIVKGSCGQSSSTSHSYDSGLLSCKSVYAVMKKHNVTMLLKWDKILCTN